MNETHTEQIVMIAEVPDGYELSKEYRKLRTGDYWLNDGQAVGPIRQAADWRSTDAKVILTKLPPDTVTVELPRETAEALTTYSRMNPVITQVLADACLAGLAAEEATRD